MVKHLVFDAVWRTRWMYIAVVPLVMLSWTPVALGYMPASNGAMLTIMLAYALGPVGSVTTMGMRELRILPVTNRHLWVATWVVSTIAIPFALTAAQSLAIITVTAFNGSSSVSTETLLLTSVYTFAYAGGLLPIVPALGYSLNNISSRNPRWLWIALSIACFLIFIGGFGLPFYFAKFLPLSLDQFSPGTFVALLGCLAVAGTGLAWTPQRGGVVSGRMAEQPARAESRSDHRLRFADRFTGVARIALPHVATALTITAVTVLGFAGYWAAFVTGSDLRAFLNRSMLLPFDSVLQIDWDGPADMLLVLGFIAACTRGVWSKLAKHLKVLPLTVRDINLLFLLTPFGTWAVVWLVLLVTHVVVVGSLPETLRPSVFIGVAGAGALAGTMALRGGGRFSPWLFFAMGLLLSVSQKVLSRASDSAELLILGAGVVATALAALVNHRTLTRSTSASKTYHPAPAPFGITEPGARP